MFKRIVGTDVAEMSLEPAVNFPHQEPLPRCFALAPLYDHLVTRQVDIKSLNDDGTLGDAVVSAVFTAIDVEGWARRFLGDLDRFLAASTSSGPGGQSALSAMLAKAIDSKRTIASAIAEQLQGVLDHAAYETAPDPDYQKGLQVARDTLRQQLHVSLLKGYDIPVMIQQDTSSTTPRAEAEPATRTDTHLGAPRVPVPLRIYPAPPSIGEQTASPTFDSPHGLQQLSLWTYKLTLAHEFAAQDTAGITTEFNLSGRLPQRRASAPGVDLFSIMAQYMAVADKLWKLLSAGLAPQSGEETSHVNATRTFADLAAAVAGHWSIRLPQDQSDSVPESDCVAGTSHTFAVRVAYSQHGAGIESVSFTREQPQVDAGNMWPEVEVLLPDGFGVAFLAQPSDPSSLTAVYVPKKGLEVPAFAQQIFQLRWSGLNVSAFQNARSRLSVVRNEDLLYDPLHPEIATPPTNPVFLLKTAEVVANSSVAPLIEGNHEREITGANLQAALEDAIQTLFPSNGLVANTRATWRLDYSYELARSDTSLGDHSPSRARVPVALLPDAPLAGIAQALANEGQRWIDTHQPAVDGGIWILGVVLHSGLESGAHPLFKADLFYRISK